MNMHENARLTPKGRGVLGCRPNGLVRARNSSSANMACQFADQTRNERRRLIPIEASEFWASAPKPIATSGHHINHALCRAPHQNIWRKRRAPRHY